MIFVISIIIFAFILGLLVFIHELGHFLAAKKAGVKVEEFGFGLPPKIKGWKRGETQYSLNWLPMGGFVRLLGEDETEANKDPRSFANKPPSVKAIIILAGVLMNLALAVVIYTLILGFNGFKADFNLIIDQRFPFGHQENSVFIAQVQSGSPAEMGGLQFADKVIAVNGQRIFTPADLQTFIVQNKGQKVVISVENINTRETREVTVETRAEPPAGEGPLGVSLGELATIEYSSFPEKVLSGVLHSINVATYSYNVTAELVSVSVANRDVRPVAEGVSGPVGILNVVNSLVAGGGFQGVLRVIELIPLISLSLAVFNVLPIPALDGGRLFFVLIELVTRRRVSPNLERWVHSIGMVVLIGLFLLITYSDIIKLFS